MNESNTHYCTLDFLNFTVKQKNKGNGFFGRGGGHTSVITRYSSLLHLIHLTHFLQNQSTTWVRPINQSMCWLSDRFHHRMNTVVLETAEPPCPTAKTSVRNSRDSDANTPAAHDFAEAGTEPFPPEPSRTRSPLDRSSWGPERTRKWEKQSPPPTGETLHYKWRNNQIIVFKIVVISCSCNNRNNKRKK